MCNFCAKCIFAIDFLLMAHVYVTVYKWIEDIHGHMSENISPIPVHIYLSSHNERHERIYCGSRYHRAFFSIRSSSSSMFNMKNSLWTQRKTRQATQKRERWIWASGKIEVFPFSIYIYICAVVKANRTDFCVWKKEENSFLFSMESKKKKPSIHTQI